MSHVDALNEVLFIQDHGPINPAQRFDRDRGQALRRSEHASEWPNKFVFVNDGSKVMFLVLIISRSHFSNPAYCSG